LLTSDQTSDLERLRSCQREKTELELRATALLGELEELRAEKEKLRLDIEQEERTHKRQLADQIAESKLYHSEKESLKSKSDSQEEDLRVSVRKQDELQQENTKLKRELDRTVSRLEENGHKFK
jgi:hypothetical protein